MFRVTAVFVFPLLAVALALTPTPAQPPKPKKYALLIGINKYNHAEMNQPKALEYAERDITAAKELFEGGGYEVKVILGEKATLTAIRAALKSLAKKGSSDGVTMIGLAGHGFQADGESEPYFCPFDTGMRARKKNDKEVIEHDPETMLPLTEVLTSLKLSPAGSRVLLADCCRNDPKSGRGGVGTGLKFGDVPGKLAVMLACSEGQRAYEDKAWGDGHGAFFYHALEGMKGKAANDRGRVTANRLAEYLDEVVPADVLRVKKDGTEQKPFTFVSGQVDLQLVQARPVEEKTYTSKTTGMKFVRIKAGTFTMGSPKEEKDRSNDEVAHEVTLTKDYLLGVYTVTRGEFRKFIEDGNTTEAESDGKGGYGWDAAKKDFVQDPKYTWRNVGFAQTDNHPVVNVSWNDAVKYAEWLSKKDGRTYRLPSEAEWEFACRAGTTTRFWFGDDEEALAKNGNVADADFRAATGMPWGIKASDGHAFTAPVGSHRPNPWGLHDMHGNVEQWCDDWYGEYSKDKATDPHGPLQGGFLRVFRGGGWQSNAGGCRSARRNWFFPGLRLHYLGFRLALVPSDR